METVYGTASSALAGSTDCHVV